MMHVFVQNCSVSPRPRSLGAFAHSQITFLTSEQEEGSWEQEQLAHPELWLLLRLNFGDMEAAEEGMR